MDRAVGFLFIGVVAKRTANPVVSLRLTAADRQQNRSRRAIAADLKPKQNEASANLGNIDSDVKVSP
jgi:hypothetical protein